jgi:DivIVA domain-containing protein
MATLDITPQELRDIEIREAWRGYHRDDVDELLERAAATIEHLETENAQLRSRLSKGPQAAAPAPAPQPAPVAPTPAPTPAPAPPVRTADTDVIQRTLVLAQKAADEAVAEAKARAAEIVSDSETKAQKLVADAEVNARRIADAEKAKLEEDIAQLMAARDTLTADVDALERFEQEYRERLRAAIEAELELLSNTVGMERPAVEDVELPSSGPSWSASQEATVVPPAAPAPAPVEPAAAPAPAAGGPSTVHIEAVTAHQAAEGDQWDPTPAGGWDAPHGADDVEHDDDVEHGDSLDDDAFFASLREAVRDDGPLGPAQEDDTAFFDQDDTDEHRRLFKRRR